MATPSLEDMLAAISKQLGTSSPLPTPARAASLVPSAVTPSAGIRPLQPFLTDRGDSGGGLPGAILSTLAWLDKPRAAVMSTIKELTDLATGKGYSTSDWREQVSSHYGFGEYQQDYLGGIENVALPDWVPGIGGKKMLRYATALAGDVMTDPFILLGGMPVFWSRAGGGAAKLSKALTAFASNPKMLARFGDEAMTAAAEGAQAMSTRGKNISTGIKKMNKTEGGREVLKHFGLDDVGLRWRQIGSGPLLGGVGRRLAPNRLASRLAKQTPPKFREELAAAVNKAVDADDLDDLIAEGIQQSWRDDVIKSVQKIWKSADEKVTKVVPVSASVSEKMARGLASDIARAGRVPLEYPFLPGWITTKPVLPRVLLNVMAAPGYAMGRLAISAVGKATSRLFVDDFTQLSNKILRAADPESPSFKADVRLGLTGTDAIRKAGSVQGNFAADSTRALQTWYRGATSNEGGFLRRKDEYALGQLTGMQTDTLEGALLEMTGNVARDRMDTLGAAGVNHLEGVRIWAADLAAAGYEIPVDTPQDLWRLIVLKKRWDATMDARRESLIRLFGSQSEEVRAILRTQAMSGEYTPGIPTKEAHTIFTAKGRDGKRLNPKLFAKELDDETAWYSSQVIEDGVGQEAYVPTPDPKAKFFVGRVKGRFARGRALHGPFLDEAALPGERLRRAQLPRAEPSAEEQISRGLHPTEAASEPWKRTGGEGPPRRFDDPVMKSVARSQPRGLEGEAFRVLPAEPDELLEAATEAVRGPRLGIDFAPKTLVDDLSGVVQGGRTVKFGGIGPDGKRLIPEDVDMMDVLLRVDPSLYKRELTRKVGEILGQVAEGKGVDLDALPAGTGFPEIAQALDVSLDDIVERALKELNDADFLEIRLQRATEQVVEYQLPDGTWMEQSLTGVARARGWTDPVNRFGWTERQQMDYYAHELGLLDADKSLYVQQLSKREDTYIRAIGQDVHMRTFERALADEGLIFSAERFYDLEQAYRVFSRRMDDWVNFVQQVGPLPEGMTVDDFIRRITRRVDEKGRLGPYRRGEPKSQKEFIKSLPPRWKRIAEIYRDATEQGVVDEIADITEKLKGLTVRTSAMQQQFDEAATAVSAAVNELHSVQSSIGLATGVMMGTLRAVNPEARLEDVFTAVLREQAPRIARHIPDLDGTLIEQWDVIRWAETEARASNLLRYLTKVRQELAALVERSKVTGEYKIGERLTDPAGAAVRAEREVALANERAAVATEMGVAMDWPIPSGERTWRRLMAFISPRERRLSTTGAGTRTMGEGGALEQAEYITREGGMMPSRRKPVTEIPPDETKIPWRGGALGLPTDAHAYSAGNFEFWEPMGGGPTRVLRRGEGVHWASQYNMRQVSRPDNANELIRQQHGAAAVEQGRIPVRRGEDVPAAARTVIKIENKHSNPQRISPEAPDLPTRTARQDAATPAAELVVPEILEDVVRFVIRNQFAGTISLGQQFDMSLLGARRMIRLLERMGILVDTGDPRLARRVVSEMPENFDAVAREALAAEDAARLAKQMDRDDAIRAGEIVNPEAPRPQQAGGRETAMFMPYASTEIEDIGAGVTIFGRGFVAENPDEAWDDVYKAVVGANVPLEAAATDPSLGERALAAYKDKMFPATYPTGRPPGAAGPNRNYVWMNKDELFALKAMERAVTLRKIQLENAAGHTLSAKDTEFLTATMGYRTAREALGNIDDDVLVLGELALNPFAKRRETGAFMIQYTTYGATTPVPTARLVPGETGEQVVAMIATAQERMQRIASRHGLDTAGGKGITVARSEGLVDKALADVFALGKRRRAVRSVVKEVDDEAAARVAADPNVPSEIAALDWSERDLSVLGTFFEELTLKLSKPVTTLKEDLIPLMVRLQEQKMATDETVQAAESLFEILTVAGPTGSFVKGAQKQWKAPTVLRKYEQIIDEVKRLEDFLGVRISGEGVRGAGRTMSQSPMRAVNPFGKLGVAMPTLDAQVAKAKAMIPPGGKTPFSATLKSVTGTLNNMIEGYGTGLTEALRSRPELRAKWIAMARADAQVVELIARDAEARLAILKQSGRKTRAAEELAGAPEKRSKLETKLEQKQAERVALPSKLQVGLQKEVRRSVGLRPDVAGGVLPGTTPTPLFAEGMVGANAPKQLIDEQTPMDAVRSMIQGAEQANIELAEIAYYVGLNEELLRILPKEVSDDVRRRLIADLVPDPRADEMAQQSVLENGWLGAQARKEYMKGHEEGLSWMHNVGGIASAGAFDPSRIPAEGFQTLLQEGASRWGANLIAMAPNNQVADDWASTVVDVLMAAQKSTDREQVGQFLRQYDKLHNWLKAQLVATPGFVMRNMLGGATNMWFKDIPPLEIIRTGKMMQQAYRAGEGDLIVGVRLMSQKNADSLAWMRMRDLVESGAHAGGQAASAVDVGIIGRSRFDFFVGQRTVEKPGTRFVYSPFSPEFTPFAAVRHANTFAEEAMRLATGMHAMKVWGDTVDEAMYMIHKLHFDYGKLSDFERKGMRRAFPFYTWTRNNLPLQVEFMGRHPAKYNRLFSLKREMERNTPEEGTVPHYFLEPFGVRMPFQIMGAQIYSVPDTPFQDLLRYDPTLGGIGSTIEQFVSQTTPIAKVPVEYWAGKQVFAGIPFTERYQQVPAIMQNVPGLMHALQQIGWAQRSKQGEWKMQDNRIHLIGNLMPFMGVLQRAIPGLPGREKRKQERYISALISTLGGLSIRMNTRYEQQSERVRREIERYIDQRDRADIQYRTR